MRLRVEEILKANPWLAGRLDWSKRPCEEGAFVLVYNDDDDENQNATSSLSTTENNF